MSQPTVAADRPISRSEDSFYERFHVSLEGGWLFNESHDNFSYADDFAGGTSLTPGRNGASFGIEVGGAMSPLYDWRARWRSNFFRTSEGSGSSSSVVGSNSGSATDALRFHTFDGEIGYRPSGTPLRLFAGARVLKASNRISTSYEADKFGVGSTFGDASHDATLLGIGPRAGLELTVPFPEQRAFFTLNGSVAAIFAKREHTFSGTESNTSPATTVTNLDFSRNVTIFNAEATATLGYRLSNNAMFELGYRAQYFNNMVPEIREVGTGSTTSGVISNNGDVLVHGPMARLTIGWK